MLVGVADTPTVGVEVLVGVADTPTVGVRVFVGVAVTVTEGVGVCVVGTVLLTPIFFHMQKRYSLSPNPAGFGSPYS